MEQIKKLPVAEFDIMKVVWANDPPITTAVIMEQLGRERKWKIQTVVSFMIRLVDRGFLHSEKHRKERIYFPVVSKEDYLAFETGNFVKQYHNGSLLNLVNALHNDQALTGADMNELLKWAKEHRG